MSFDGVVIRGRAEFTVWNDTDELILKSKGRQPVLSEAIQQGLPYLHHGGYGLCPFR